MCHCSIRVSQDYCLPMKVLKALQEAVTNHNLATQPSPAPPEPAPATAAPVKIHTRQTPVHSFQVNQAFVLILHRQDRTMRCKSADALGLRLQVKLVRYGRQTVSVDVDAGVLLFDRKPGSFGVERVSHDRSKRIFETYSVPYASIYFKLYITNIMSACMNCLNPVLEKSWRSRGRRLPNLSTITAKLHTLLHFVTSPVLQSSRLSSSKTARQRSGWWLTATTTLHGR